jgi:hypothetical protein
MNHLYHLPPTAWLFACYHHKAGVLSKGEICIFFITADMLDLGTIRDTKSFKT